MYQYPNSRDLMYRPCPTAPKPKVVADIHQRIAQLESVSKRHRFPDQTVTNKPTCDFTMGVTGQKIPDNPKRTTIREYKPKNSPSNPLLNIHPALNKRTGCKGENPIELCKMHEQIQNPIPVLPSIEKKKKKSKPNEMSTVHLPQEPSSFPDANKPKRKEWLHAAQNNIEVIVTVSPPKKTGDNKVPSNKGDIVRVHKKPLALKPLTEVSEASVWKKLEKKHDLQRPDGLTALRQDCKNKHKFYDEVGHVKSKPRPRYLANNFDQVQHDHWRQVWGLKTRKNVCEEIECVKIDRDVLLVDNPPSHAKPTKRKARRRKQEKGD